MFLLISSYNDDDLHGHYVRNFVFLFNHFITNSTYYCVIILKKIIFSSNEFRINKFCILVTKTTTIN